MESIYIIIISHPSTLKLKEKGAMENDNELINRYKESGGSGINHQKISEREDEYHQQRMNRRLSPERGDMFGDKTPERKYDDILKEERIKSEMDETYKKIDEIERKKDEDARNTLKRKWEDESPKDNDIKKSKWNDETPSIFNIIYRT